MQLLERIKESLEFDLTDSTFDEQITTLLKSGLGYLSNNNIPVPNFEDDENISIEKYRDEGDYWLAVEWLAFYVLIRIDTTIQNLSMDFVQSEMSDKLLQLKVRYRVI